MKAITATLLATLALLAGCGGTEVRPTSVSKGQELSDLKKALDSGAISANEYERLRRQVIDREY